MKHGVEARKTGYHIVKTLEFIFINGKPFKCLCFRVHFKKITLKEDLWQEARQEVVPAEARDGISSAVKEI